MIWNNSQATVLMRETKREFRYQNTVVLTLSMKYPEISLRNSPIAETRINARIHSQTTRFTRYASNTLYRQAVRDYKNALSQGYPFRPYEAILNYQVPYYENCYLSAYRDQYEYTGGAHGSTIRLSDTWNLKTGARIPLSRFFPRGSNYRKFLIDQIVKQAEHNMHQNPDIYFADYKTRIYKYFDPESYYLTPSGLCIYYQQYTIAPYATGIALFLISYRTLQWYPSCI